jgi:hemolysin D
MQRQFLIEQTAEQRAKLAALDSQEVQKLAERTSRAAAIEKLESVILHARAAYLETLQTLVEAQKELKVQQS